MLLKFHQQNKHLKQSQKIEPPFPSYNQWTAKIEEEREYKSSIPFFVFPFEFLPYKSS